MTTTRRDADPTERPLALDAREAPRRRSPAPVTLLISLVVLAGLGGGVYYLYRGGVRGPSGPPAPVGVPIRDVRVAAPPQPEQPDPAAGLSIYKETPGNPATQAPPAPKFVSAPEQPTPRPAPGQEVLVAPAAGPIAAAPADVPAAKPVRTASIDTLLANPPPAKTSDASPATSGKAVGKPADATNKDSGFVVQIGAFSSQTLADKSWDSAAEIAPGAMAGKGKHIAPMQRDGATLYRVAVTGFSSRGEAAALCAKLSAAGRTCFVR